MFIIEAGKKGNIKNKNEERRGNKRFVLRRASS